MGILHADYFFAGFGFARYQPELGWKSSPLDELERQICPKRPLLSYLDKLDQRIPKRYDYRLHRAIVNDDWLIFEGRRQKELK
jgi:hypothetical protein